MLCSWRMAPGHQEGPKYMAAIRLITVPIRKGFEGGPWQQKRGRARGLETSRVNIFVRTTILKVKKTEE